MRLRRPWKVRRGGEGERGGGVDLEGVLDATADEVAILEEDLLDQAVDDDEEGSTACIFACPH
jgi:hypothetical protein